MNCTIRTSLSHLCLDENLKSTTSLTLYVPYCTINELILLNLTITMNLLIKA
jgi:hypothetical protein